MEDIHERVVADMKTYVRIASPVGSSFDGRTGPVVRTEGDTLFVRVTLGGRGSVVVPFGRTEVEVLGKGVPMV